MIVSTKTEAELKAKKKKPFTSEEANTMADAYVQAGRAITKETLATMKKLAEEKADIKKTIVTSFESSTPLQFFDEGAGTFKSGLAWATGILGDKNIKIMPTVRGTANLYYKGKSAAKAMSEDMKLTASSPYALFKEKSALGLVRKMIAFYNGARLAAKNAERGFVNAEKIGSVTQQLVNQARRFANLGEEQYLKKADESISKMQKRIQNIEEYKKALK